MVSDRVYDLLHKISNEIPKSGAILYVSPHTARMIKLHAPTVLDPETRKDKLEEGRLGYLWNCELRSKDDLEPWIYEILKK